jgi:hypothetical protein
MIVGVDTDVDHALVRAVRQVAIRFEMVLTR